MDPPADGAVTGAIVDLSVADAEYAETREVELVAATLWQMARSDLEDLANTVPTTFSHDSVIQSICMVAELSRNASLGWKGQAGMLCSTAAALGRVSRRLPAMVVENLRGQWAPMLAKTRRTARSNGVLHCGNSGSLRVTAIPGVGVLGGMAVVAMKSDTAAFPSGCEFAA